MGAHEELEKVGVNMTVRELVGQETFDWCMQKKYCIVAVLPHLYDSGASGRNEYLSIVSELTKKGRAISNFVWVQGGNQEQLENTFKLDSGFPALIAINKDRKRYAVHKGAFTAEAM